MAIWKFRLRRRSNLERAKDALHAMSGVGYDMEEDLPEVEGWLDGLTSTLSELADLKVEPDNLEGVIDRARKRPEFARLAGVREDIARLYELSSCVAYGVSSLSSSETIEAGSCFENVFAAVEKLLNEVDAKMQGKNDSAS